MPITATSLLRFWDMACSLSLEPLARFVTGGAGARPDHPISGHKRLRIAAAQPDPLNPISLVAKPCCNRVLIGVVPALGRAMRRRDFIKVIVGSGAAWPRATRAQQPDRMRLIGVLMGYAESDRVAQSWLAAFRGALPKLGWTEGSNLRIEVRWSADDADWMRTLAKE